MPKLKILVTGPKHEPSSRKLAADPGVELRLEPEPPAGVHGESPQPWPVEWLGDTDILFCSGVFPPNFAEMKKVRWVQMASAGYEYAIPHNLPGRGIRASNCLGVFDAPIAEWNIAMIVNLARDLRGMLRNQERGHWDRDLRFQREIRGSTVGFWGYGGLARETARVAKTMGLNVHVLVRHGVKQRTHYYVLPGTGDPEGKLPDRVFTPDQRFEFLKGLDFLVMGVPLTPTSRGMIGEAELHALPRHAYLLNPARGPLIQEQALLRALREGWIAGAALDAHFYYPLPPDHPLWSMPNVILTPHVSGCDTQSYPMQAVWDIFLQNLPRFRAGQPLLNELSEANLRGE